MRELIQNHPALNWLPAHRQDSLAREIEADPHYAEFRAHIDAVERDDAPEPDALLALAMKIARGSDLSIERDGTVLFSGDQQKFAERHVAANDGADVIHSRPAGAMLELLNLFSALEKLEAYAAWDALGVRIAHRAAGNVTAFVDGSKPDSTFRSVELPILLANDKVKTINGADKKEFTRHATKMQRLSAIEAFNAIGLSTGGCRPERRGPAQSKRRGPPRP